MEKRRVASACILSLILIIGGAFAQAQVAVTVEGIDGAKTTYTLDQLRQMTQQSVAATNYHTKATENYAGVLLTDLLAKVNTPSGDKLRGDEMRDYVEVAGRDGYRAVFALAELDPAFQDNHVLVAITMDGKPLDDKAGPVRIVAPQDKRPARSVRMVTTITVRRAP